MPLAFLFIAFTPGFAQKKFDFNNNCQKAYKEIIWLKLKSGQEILDNEKKTNPDNLIPYFLENYIDFFILFFNQDPAEYKIRKERGENRVQLMKSGPASSPLYLFTRSVIQFQWAAVHIKFAGNWDAAWEFRRSFINGKENLEKFPQFSPAIMLNSAMQVAAGTIPSGYKWLSNLLGIKGTIKQGMGGLEKFIEQNDSWAQLFRDEAIFYYLYLKFYIENKKEEVFTFISQQQLDIKNNHLFTYLAANLAVNDQQAAYAQRILEQRNMSADYLKTPVWDLEMGYAKIDHLEPDAAIYLERFINEFKGKFYVKDILQKLSWFYYLQGNAEKAKDYRNQILKKGSLDTEADKTAFKDAKTNRWPNVLLLKARLLNDGGYHKEALQILEGKSSSDFSLSEDKLELAYRLGRIYDDLGRKDEAIAAYLTTIKLGQQRKEYFAARAALQIGYIYEKRSDKPTAIAYFEKVIDMKDHDYKNSLDQKAKAGIARCKNE
ncbi:MAG: tetratricopeptide repeat protein [Bacteroidetes bacterium]|nr:tetratricopeptide repeat protein [Bacteroidota bacterium]